MNVRQIKTLFHIIQAAFFSYSCHVSRSSLISNESDEFSRTQDLKDKRFKKSPI